jgi:hypothetical protein
VASVGRTEDGRPFIVGAGVLPPLDEPPPAPPAVPQAKPAKHKAAGERFATLNAFVDCSMARRTRSELATWLVLYRDTRNGTAATSQADIARRAGLSVRAVKRAVAGLQAAGLLSVCYTGGLNRGPSRYRVRPLDERTPRGTGER